MKKKNITYYPVRHHLVIVTMSLLAGVLLWRCIDLTLEDKEFLQKAADERHIRVETMPAHRGMILDRNGHPLAVSTPVESVWANPGVIVNDRSKWPQLAKLLDIKTEELHQLIASRQKREFIYLKRHLSPQIANKVRALKIEGLGLTQEFRRYYPAGEIAAHIIGFTNIDDQGQEGIELAYNDWLQGVPGKKRVIKNRLGQIIDDIESIREPRQGKDLYLSIDRRIQYLAYRELKSAVKKNRAKSGSLVIIDVKTGEVLAMVNQPAYNPNKREERTSRKIRNLSVTDVFEPGSTIKPFTVAAGLMSGLFSDKSIINTSPGYFKVGKYTVRDTHNYGSIDLKTLLKKSSNIGASKIALEIDKSLQWDTLHKLGFGQFSGSGFPGETSGILTDYSQWGDAHRATLSYGYGLSVSMLQLTRAYAALANNGFMNEVSFLKLEPEDVTGKQVINAQTSNDVLHMLEGVLSDGGTAKRARVTGFRVAGKTGTAHKSVNGGYAEDRYLAVFAGIAPVTEPRIAMVVLINEPGGDSYYGGQVAAPVFANVASGALRILGAVPDDPGSSAAQLITSHTPDKYRGRM